MFINTIVCVAVTNTHTQWDRPSERRGGKSNAENKKKRWEQKVGVKTRCKIIVWCHVSLCI